jgi:Tfp pilus assembly protein PilO
MKEKSQQTIYLNILVAVLTAVVLITAWKVVAPSYSSEKSRKIELENEVALARQRLEWLDSSKAELAANKELLNQLFVAVPEDSDAPNLISELEAIAIKNSLVIPSIGIQDNSQESLETGLSISNTVTISLSVTGNFENINAFINSLEKSVKFMNIQSLTYSNSEESGTSISLEVEAYKQIGQSTDLIETGSEEGV